jgi:hypothetical protein
VAKIEYAVDEWDLRGGEPELDAAELLQHLRRFGDEGWELVTISFNVELKDLGRGHLSIFRRPAVP